MPERAGREALGYIEPKAGDNKDDFSQCGSCKHWLKDKLKCDEIPELSGVDADDSCDYYAPRRGLTAKEAGFVKRRVQCRRCRFGEDGATHCWLYEQLNKKCPDILSLNPNIKPNACCDMQTPKANHLS